MQDLFMPIVIGLVIMLSPVIVFGLDKLVKPTHSWVRAAVFFVLCGACSFALVTAVYMAHNALM